MYPDSLTTAREAERTIAVTVSNLRPPPKLMLGQFPDLKSGNSGMARRWRL